MAYGHYGYLYVTFGNGQLHQVDPSTGQSVGVVTNLAPAQPGSGAGGGASTDLASCASPSTLTVRKNVHSRAQDTDQYQLSAVRQGTVEEPTRAEDFPVGEPATTTGAEAGPRRDRSDRCRS